MVAALARTGTTENSYGYRGEEQDETGLYYLRARYMDPSTGTFTTMDTYAGRLSDPMSLHKYMYANSNPVMNVDPSGHFTRDDLMECISIESILFEVCSNTFTYVLNWFVNTPDDSSLSNFASGLSKAIIWGAVSGLFGGFISRFFKVDGLAGTLITQTKNGNSALVYIITHPKMFSALILLTVMLWGGLVLKVSSNSDEVENEDVSAAMETTGDVLLDSAYVFISEFLGLPPNTISFCVDLVIIFVKFLRGESLNEI